MTRDEAVAWLRAAGHHASARDWALGATIRVTYGEPIEPDIYPGGVYLAPTDSGAWELYDFFRRPPFPTATYESLDVAVRAVHEYIARKEQERRDASSKPDQA